MKVTLSEALLGFNRILLNHLDGRGIQVASPPRKAIKPGQAIVLRGEGMPIYKKPDERGNLYVMLDVEMPDEQWLQGIDYKVGTFLKDLQRNIHPHVSHRHFSY